MYTNSVNIPDLEDKVEPKLRKSRSAYLLSYCNHYLILFNADGKVHHLKVLAPMKVLAPVLEFSIMIGQRAGHEREIRYYEMLRNIFICNTVKYAVKWFKDEV